MTDTIHIAKKGDTLWDLSRKYYGVPTRYEEIIKNNQFFQDRRTAKNLDSTGIPFVFIGDKIVISRDPSPADLAIKVSDFKSDLNFDGVTIYLNGEKTEFSSNTKIKTHFDSCCNIFSSSRSWDPSNLKQRKLWDPIAPPTVEIWIKNEQIFGGRVEEINPQVKSNKSTLEISARTNTRLLLKSVFPVTAYPIEREGENLPQIVEWACGVFGLGSVDLSTPDSEYLTKILKSSCDNSSKVFEYLNQLATAKSRVLNSSADGNTLQIVDPVISDPVARFQEGVDGFSIPEFKYNTALLSGNYLGSSETADKPDNLETFKDPHFKENSYGYFKIEDSGSGESQKSLSYQALKKYRDFFTTSFSPTGGGFFNKVGQLYKVGDIITLNAPSAMIYDDYNFLIRSVEYLIDSDQNSVVLHIIPPAVYSGKALDSLPFSQ